MPSSRTFSRDISEDAFAVVKDTERNTIVASGDIAEMLNLAEVYNREYQSTAYKAIRWTDGRIY